ncbi:hypothetical protein SCHPADRAFT_897811 [Schizopora paradoxa]|uniref:Uncharacterized protein n=1 Tax=Schizopora paradoxa TaxID=27342 RepID=A0A0H2SFG3_9AGAM|nr:hypothetical protein SCHPADRAFT_897811 [Schizopora paradoxa]
MSGATAMYPTDDTSQHSHYLPSYPPRAGLSFDDTKQTYDEDIIDSYASAEVQFPPQARQSYYPHSPASPYTTTSVDVRRQSQNHLYNLKQHDARTIASDMDSTLYDGGGGSSYPLKAVAEKPESSNILDTLLPDSLACRLYVLTVLLETIVDISIELDLYLRVKSTDGGESFDDLSNKRLPVYLGIFAFAHVFQLGMAIDAVHNRNTLQFLFLTLFNALFLLYAVIQKFEIQNSIPSNAEGLSGIPVNVLTTIIPIVISVAEVAYIALGWKIWREFGWKVYKRLGANRQVKRMFAHYQIFVCVMKFDVFFFIGFSVQLIFLVLDQHNWQFYVTCAALPFSIILLTDGILAARYENRHMMITFMLGLGGAMVYFVYKLFSILANKDTIQQAAMTLAVFAILAILSLLVTFVMAVIVMRNFGGGLKFHMSKNKDTPGFQRRGTVHQNRHSIPLGIKSNRMSID